MHPQRHHERLPQGIDRGIRDLGEALADVRVQTWRYAGERRDGGVVPHTPHGVLCGAAHRLEHVTEILEAPAESDLLGDALAIGRRRSLGYGRRRPQGTNASSGPAAVGAASGDFALRLGVPEDRLATGVNNQDLARAEPAALYDLCGIQIDQSRLGAGDNQAVAGDLVATGAEPVAVEG